MPGQTVDETKYIVFLDHHCWSSLHTVHRAIANTYTGEVAYVQGTFTAVKQHCSHCEHQRQRTSQPRIKDTPTGNIVLSAAILYGGATPGKVIRMLIHMTQCRIMQNNSVMIHRDSHQ